MNDNNRNPDTIYADGQRAQLHASGSFSHIAIGLVIFAITLWSLSVVGPTLG